MVPWPRRIDLQREYRRRRRGPKRIIRLRRIRLAVLSRDACKPMADLAITFRVLGGPGLQSRVIVAANGCDVARMGLEVFETGAERLRVIARNPGAPGRSTTRMDCVRLAPDGGRARGGHAARRFWQELQGSMLA